MVLLCLVVPIILVFVSNHDCLDVLTARLSPSEEILPNGDKRITHRTVYYVPNTSSKQINDNSQGPTPQGPTSEEQIKRSRAQWYLNAFQGEESPAIVKKFHFPISSNIVDSNKSNTMSHIETSNVASANNSEEQKTRIYKAKWTISTTSLKNGRQNDSLMTSNSITSRANGKNATAYLSESNIIKVPVTNNNGNFLTHINSMNIKSQEDVARNTNELKNDMSIKNLTEELYGIELSDKFGSESDHNLLNSHNNNFVPGLSWPRLTEDIKHIQSAFLDIESDSSSNDEKYSDAENFVIYSRYVPPREGPADWQLHHHQQQSKQLINTYYRNYVSLMKYFQGIKNERPEQRLKYVQALIQVVAQINAINKYNVQHASDLINTLYKIVERYKYIEIPPAVQKLIIKIINEATKCTSQDFLKYLLREPKKVSYFNKMNGQIQTEQSQMMPTKLKDDNLVPVQKIPYLFDTDHFEQSYAGGQPYQTYQPKNPKEFRDFLLRYQDNKIPSWSSNDNYKNALHKPPSSTLSNIKNFGFSNEVPEHMLNFDAINGPWPKISPKSDYLINPKQHERDDLYYLSIEDLEPEVDYTILKSDPGFPFYHKPNKNRYPIYQGWNEKLPWSKHDFGDFVSPSTSDLEIEKSRPKYPKNSKNKNSNSFSQYPQKNIPLYDNDHWSHSQQSVNPLFKDHFPQKNRILYDEEHWLQPKNVFFNLYYQHDDIKPYLWSKQQEREYADKLNSVTSTSKLKSNIAFKPKIKKIFPHPPFLVPQEWPKYGQWSNIHSVKYFPKEKKETGHSKVPGAKPWKLWKEITLDDNNYVTEEYTEDDFNSDEQTTNLNSDYYTNNKFKNPYLEILPKMFHDDPHKIEYSLPQGSTELSDDDYFYINHSNINTNWGSKPKPNSYFPRNENSKPYSLTMKPKSKDHFGPFWFKTNPELQSPNKPISVIGNSFESLIKPKKEKNPNTVYQYEQLIDMPTPQNEDAVLLFSNQIQNKSLPLKTPLNRLAEKKDNKYNLNKYIHDIDQKRLNEVWPWSNSNQPDYTYSDYEISDLYPKYDENDMKEKATREGPYIPLTDLQFAPNNDLSNQPDINNYYEDYLNPMLQFTDAQNDPHKSFDHSENYLNHLLPSHIDSSPSYLNPRPVTESHLYESDQYHSYYHHNSEKSKSEKKTIQYIQNYGVPFYPGYGSKPNNINNFISSNNPTAYERNSNFPSYHISSPPTAYFNKPALHSNNVLYSNIFRSTVDSGINTDGEKFSNHDVRSNEPSPNSYESEGEGGSDLLHEMWLTEIKNDNDTILLYVKKFLRKRGFSPKVIDSLARQINERFMKETKTCTANTIREIKRFLDQQLMHQEEMT